ncbi:MAG TPA: aspartyl protease family protein [Terriglobales bacterium]|nr:aspartyl protease family protein [Terriglobales bacterium]
MTTRLSAAEDESGTEGVKFTACQNSGHRTRLPRGMFFVRRIRCWRLFLVMLVASTVSRGQSPVTAKVSIAAGSKTSTTLPFELIDNRVFVEVHLNGRGPFHFILDTGANGFSLTDTTVQKLGLKMEDAGVASGVGEKTVHVSKAHLREAQLGNLQFRDLETEVLPGGDAVNVFGTKPVDGVVGLEVFQRVVVKHDYVRRVLTFSLPDKFDYRGAGVIVPFERPRQIPVIDAELDGVRGKFGVDTGARSSLLLYTPFVDENRLREKYGARLEGVTGWGIGGPVRSLLARAAELKIGNVVVRDLVVRLSTQKHGLTTSSAMAGLIGPDVLSQFDVTFDYSRSRIIFEKNSRYGRRDSYDRAGLWMGQRGEHFFAVDVIAGGPAADAGVRQDDIILAIDGIDTAKLILPDVREKIRREPVGQKITLLLDSAGKRHSVVFKLRDLV